MSRRLRPILIAAVLIVGTWMVMPADAQGRFWVLVNGALKYTGAVTINGPLTLTGKVASYNTVATAGWGVPAIQAMGRATAQTAAVASVATYTVGAADGSFEVSANMLATTSTSYTININVTYTDETSSVRTVPLNMMLVGGSITNSAALTNVNGPLFQGVPMSIRCKAATAITIATAGTFTTITYNVEGTIKQVG